MPDSRDELILEQLEEIRAILTEHSKQLEALGRIAEQLVAERAWAMYLPDAVDQKFPSRSESDIKLDELMAEIEKLPPDELKRQMEAAAALLLEEQSCQPPP